MQNNIDLDEIQTILGLDVTGLNKEFSNDLIDDSFIGSCYNLIKQFSLNYSDGNNLMSGQSATQLIKINPVINSNFTEFTKLQNQTNFTLNEKSPSSFLNLFEPENKIIKEKSSHDVAFSNNFCKIFKEKFEENTNLEEENPPKKITQILTESKNNQNGKNNFQNKENKNGKKFKTVPVEEIFSTSQSDNIILDSNSSKTTSEKSEPKTTNSGNNKNNLEESQKLTKEEKQDTANSSYNNYNHNSNKNYNNKKWNSKKSDSYNNQYKNDSNWRYNNTYENSYQEFGAEDYYNSGENNSNTYKNNNAGKKNSNYNNKINK